METKYHYRGFDILHTIKPRMKNIYLRIGDDGVVKVSSSKISQHRLFKLIDEKASWIMKSCAKLEEKPSAVLGEEILWLGEVCALHDDARFVSLLALNKKLTKERVKLSYQNFYKREAQSHLKKRLEHFSKQMGLRPKEMKLRRMQRQWGNCRSSGVITFNIHLMQTPESCIDYVVVHELAHMVHMNHSKAFHALVEKHLPNSREKRERLKNYSAGF